MTISKLSKSLEDTSKFKRVNVEEGKALNHLIHMEKLIIRLLKSLKEMIYIHQVLDQEFYMGLLKSIKY